MIKKIINDRKEKIAPYLMYAGIITTLVLGIRYSNVEDKEKLKTFFFKQYEFNYDEVKDCPILEVYDKSQNKKDYYLTLKIEKYGSVKYFCIFDDSEVYNSSFNINNFEYTEKGVLNDYLIETENVKPHYTEKELVEMTSEFSKKVNEKSNTKSLVING